MSSLKYRVRHQTTYEYSTSVQVSLNQVMLTPRDASYQRKLWHHLRVDVDHRDTSPPLRRRNDYYGNSILAFSFEESHRLMKIASMSNVEVYRPPPPEIGQAPVWENVAESVRTGV
ncbi:MAG TPA: hypothetical protein DDW52_09890, partial [Planctomycetaceae bacterium]|nr:hypothetical protein [Planctomycetaceae bacterium]